MASETFSFSVASVVEDVLQQHGTTSNRHRDLDFESRRAEEASCRRYEATGWLRKLVGVVVAKDLPAEPSEEEFRLGLRSGIILCNALNKIQPGAVPKVVESPCDPTLIPDGAALSAFQYFENVRNFLVATDELGIPSFDASDLEHGGKSVRVVNCVLALKSYNEWKQSGGIGVWKFGGNVKPAVSAKPFVRKNSEPFTHSLSRNSSMGEKSLNVLCANLDSNKMPASGSLSTLVRSVLLDKRPEDIPMLVESVLNKVVEEFEHRISSHHDLVKKHPKDLSVSQNDKFSLESTSSDKKVEGRNLMVSNKNECLSKHISENYPKNQSPIYQKIFNEQQKEIQELKHTIHVTRNGMQFMQMKFHEEFNNLGMHINGLAHAASGYNKVLEENRKLYNQVQDLKGSIRVYCRVRPFLSIQSNSFSTVDNIEDGTIAISIPSKQGKGYKSFNFNKVFGPSATQAEVFSDMQPLVRSVLDGYNVCIFAYGQTGSGKTYTMTGPKDLTENSLGVNYRALSDLFLIAEERKDILHYNVAVQMIEIYNEQVRDLLVTDGSNKRFEIRNSSQTGLNVPDANLIPVSSTSDVIDLMNLGQKNRAVGSTALNDRSSRSHSCLTVHVQGRDLTSGVVLRGCMHLVDLAGSERVNKSEVTGDRLKEAQHINKSLSALGDVIASLAQKNSHIPYRNSKLTQLLQDSLGGQAKTLMFVHISPEPDATGETISTLKFAERVATVELGAARVNKDTADVKELKEQIASLKAALARKEGDQNIIQHSAAANSEMYRRRDTGASPFSSKQQLTGVDVDNSFRQPMGDVGNIEVDSLNTRRLLLQVNNTNATRKKNQSFDLDDLLANSPPWPPVISPSKNHTEDEKEMGAGEWVDKVMVNKQDVVNRAENSLGCWKAENDFYQKFLGDATKVFPEQPYDILLSNNNRLNVVCGDDTDELDATTSDSSEPDLLWQFNHSKLSSIGKPKTKIPTSKATETPDLRKNLNLMLGASPSRKLPNRTGIPLHKSGKLAVQVDGKRRAANRK